MILTTRPVLFLVFQQRKATSQQLRLDERAQSHLPNMTTALADNCVRAARNINRILTQLWIEGSVATYGYTDALILFTSSMVLMVAVALGLDNTTEDRDNMETALRLLSSMRESGNRAAAEFCEHLELLRQDLGLREFHSVHTEEIHLGEHEPHQLMALESSFKPPLSNTAAASDTATDQIRENGIGNSASTINQNPGSQIDDSIWRYWDTAPLSTSFYIQADSINMMENGIAGQNDPRPNDTTSQAASSGPWESGNGSRDSISRINDMLMHDFRTGDNDGGVGIGGLEEAGAVWNNMAFTVDMEDMNDEAIRSIPFLWG